jgi:hypothetical protein
VAVNDHAGSDGVLPGLSLDRTAWRVIVVTAGLFVLLVVLRLHGFSLPMWHSMIDGSPETEVLLGKTRPIRSDDWLVQLPLILAQLAHDPPFPVINENIGLGQNMLLPLQVPVAHPLAVFRPTLWGFFLGGDVGLAWMWWSQLLGFFLVWFLVLRLVTRGRTLLSLVASVFLTYSPFLQFWSLNAAPIATFAGIAILAAAHLATARTHWGRLGSGVVLGWAGGCFVLTTYPPYQVVIGQLVAVVLVALALERPTRVALRAAPVERAAFAGVAVAIALGVALLLYTSAHEVISLMLGTAYPGQRVSHGGHTPLWQVLNSNLWTALEVEQWGPLLNVCEAASFWLFWPVVSAGVAWRWLGEQERRVDPLVVGLVLYCLALTLYCTLGAPDWLARGTLLSWVTSRRAVLGIGLADALLLARFLALGVRSEGSTEDRNDRMAAVIVGTAFGGLMLYCGIRLRDALPGLSLMGMATLVAANGVLAYLIVRRWRIEVVMGLLAIGMVISSAWFNPLVRGGASYLTENPLARKILQIELQDGGGGWIGYELNGASNLLRALGVRSLTGVYAVPQIPLWRTFDREGAQQDVYNRYGHAFVRRRRAGDETFLLVGADGFVLAKNPTDPEFRELGITHVLHVGRYPHPEARFPELEYVDSVGWNHLFRIPKAPAPQRTRE